MTQPPKGFLLEVAMLDFVQAMARISDHWDPVLENNYPFQKDLDELLQDVQDWRANLFPPSSKMVDLQLQIMGLRAELKKLKHEQEAVVRPYPFTEPERLQAEVDNAKVGLMQSRPAVRKGLFFLDPIGAGKKRSPKNQFEGYTSGAHWNGWAQPLFERAEVERMLVDPRFGWVTKVYDETYDRYVFDDAELTQAQISSHLLDDNDYLEGHFNLMVATSEEHLIDGRAVKLYPVGTGMWTWVELEDNRPLLDVGFFAKVSVAVFRTDCVSKETWAGELEYYLQGTDPKLHLVETQVFGGERFRLEAQPNGSYQVILQGTVAIRYGTPPDEVREKAKLIVESVLLLDPCPVRAFIVPDNGVTLTGSRHQEPYAATFGFDDTPQAEELVGFSYGETWNGWAVPYLELAEAKRAMVMFNPQEPTENDPMLVFDEETKTFSFDYGDGDPTQVIEAEMLMMPEWEESRLVYKLGLGLCWTETQLDDSNERRGSDDYPRGEGY